MKIEPSELFFMIPVEERNRIMNQMYCEYEFDFMGFEEIYKAVAESVSKDRVILDMGCYLAAQCYLFQDFKAYIGIDMEEMERFTLPNVTHYTGSIQTFIKDVFPALGIDKQDCFVVCSYVPDEKAKELIKETFPSCFIYYPGEPIYATRDYKEKILRNLAEDKMYRGAVLRELEKDMEIER